jgi:A/G-specific adenine glycosylase
MDPTEFCQANLGLELHQAEDGPRLRHTFSHFHLDITTLLARVSPLNQAIMEGRAQVWYNSRRPDARGLPAPVKNLLEELDNQPG